MENKIEVIGATNQTESIASMLGVNGEAEYGLYKETANGKYYAKRLPDGKLDPSKLVRLLSDAQAAELEAKLCAIIERESAQIPELIKSIPVIDPEKMHQRVMGIAESIGAQVKASINDLALDDQS